MKTCTKCLIEKPESEFSKNGKYLKSQCKACRSAYEKQWRAESPDFSEKNRQQYREWYAKDPDHARRTKAAWTKANKAKWNAKTARRSAAQKQAIPKWADDVKIQEFYDAADFLGMVTGEWYHVDHIVPLQSKIVCGLHTEQNLQVLPASANLRKSNRQWPDMP